MATASDRMVEQAAEGNSRSAVRTPANADVIVQRLSEGTPLRQICRELGVSKSEVYRWKDDDAELAGRIARARDDGFDALAEECLEIAEEEPQRTSTQFGDKVDAGFVQHQKNRVEARLKLLAKWDPKRYGDKVQLSGDGGGPIQHQVNVSALSETALRELAALEVGDA